MQRRLLISMLAVAIVAVVALRIPLAFVLGRLQINEANQSLHTDAQAVVRALLERQSDGLPIGETYAARQARELSDRYVVISEGGHALYKSHHSLPSGARSTTVTESPFTVTVGDGVDLAGNLTTDLLLIGGVALLAVGVAVVLRLLD